ncbi:MAG: right-handed parallel beta-helix repeat-containing protein [Phycisphaerales bacterium]
MRSRHSVLMYFLAALVTVLGLPTEASAQSQTIYIDANCGNDSRSGNTPDCGAGANGPKRTIQGALDALGENNQVVISMAEGDYEPIDSIVINVSDYNDILIRGAGVGLTRVLGSQISGRLFDLTSNNNQARLTFLDLTIRDSGNASIDGGAVRIGAGVDLGVIRCRVLNSSARNGAGIYARAGSILNLTDSTFDVNAAFEDGGGIYFEGVTDSSGSLALNVNTTTFRNNTASGRGGGMFVDNETNDDGRIVGSTFETNIAGIDGGGLYVNASHDFFVGDCAFIGNESDGDAGGGIQFFNCNNPEVIDSTFQGNSAGRGGGLSAERSNGSIGFGGSIRDCVFMGNSATFAAGGIWLTAEFTVNRCQIEENSASFGGGIRVNNGGELVLTNTIIAENDAQTGTALYLRGTSRVENCTLAFNGSGGTAVLSDDATSDIVIRNTIAFNNGAEISSVGTITVDHSLVQSGWSGPGSNNIDANPRFVASPTGDYSLLPDSPCLDAGSNALTTTSIDVFARDRIDHGICIGNEWNPVVDMGAIERQFLVPVTLRVDADATDCGGTSWAQPTTSDFAFAMAVAREFSGVQRILVKEGTYTVDSGTGIRTRTVRMDQDIEVFGGFDAVNPENDPADRDPSATSTLTGEIGGPGTLDNTHRLIYGGETGWLIDGFRFESARADGGPGLTQGAAIQIDDGNGELVDCVFVGNFAAQGGGAMAVTASGNVAVRGCRFENNTSVGPGGAIDARNGQIEIFDSVLVGNESTNDLGGGMAFAFGRLDRVTIADSRSPFQGAGLYVTAGGPVSQLIENTVIRDNRVGTGPILEGAGVFLALEANVELRNCTITGNDSDAGTGDGLGLFVRQTATADVVNTIIWGNGASDIDGAAGFLGAARNSIFPGSWPGAGVGIGNIDADPQFGPDLVCGPFSPALDAGDDSVNISPVDVRGPGFGRRIDGACAAENWPSASFNRIDIGALESPQWVVREGDFDCNENNFPDQFEAQGRLNDLIASLGDPELSGQFRGTAYPDYRSIVAAYGRPWAPGTMQDPTQRIAGFEDDPARSLLEVALYGLCDPLVDRLLAELADMYLLLGNEAYGDAIDATTGLFTVGDPPVPVEPADFFAFEGVPGINTLIDEELALLRGREIDLDFDSNESTQYPNIGGFPAAIYNRLAPNAGGIGDGAVAYRQTYGLQSDLDAAQAYPQGHGDAYGHYLSAVTGYTRSFGDPNIGPYLAGIQPTDTEDISAGGGLGPVAVPYVSVRTMAEAMAARARAASAVVDRTFRADYVEGDPNPGASIVDADTERAWGTRDWAARSAMGAYLDWALVNHLMPDGDEDAGFETPNRRNLDDIDQLTGAIAEMQSRVDWAASGRNPLGLIDNVVPFGINAGSLENFIVDGSGQSHYEQVREPTIRALENARTVFNWANETGQRMRDSAETFGEFAEWTAEQEFDYRNQLIELYGLASPDDLMDNDFNPQTNDVEEAQLPDLTSFLLTDDDLFAVGLAPRPAPGEIQLASAEVRIAQFGLEQANAALAELNGNIAHLKDDIEQRRINNDQVIQVIWDAGNQLVDLETRQEDLELAQFETDELDIGLGILGEAIGGMAGCSGAGECASGFLAGGASAGISAYQAERAAQAEQERVEGTFDINRERILANAWQDAELAGIEGDNEVMDMTRELEGLIRQTPQVMIEIATAREQVDAAIGRLAAAIASGERLQADRERMRKLADDELEQFRYEDIAFRVFRNDSLQKYRGFRDLAARYVMLAARSFAYEYNQRETVEELLAGLHRESRLGGSINEGIWSVIGTVDALKDAEQLTAPFNTDDPSISFSLRSGLLGLPNDEGDPEAFADGSARFRAWLESQIVQQLESVPEIERFTQLTEADDFGPAIVLRLGTQIVPGANFFGQPITAGGQFQNANFNTTFRSHMVLDYEVQFEMPADGFEALSDDERGRVNVWVLPVGDSVFREPGGSGTVEEQPVREWSVVNQNLQGLLAPVPPGGAWQGDADFNAWVDVANFGSDYNAIQPFTRSTGQVPEADTIGEPIRNSDRVGRSAWNTSWLIAIPGGQWTKNDPDVIRDALMTFIYGQDPSAPSGVLQPADPSLGLGITDIVWNIQGYRRQN